MRHLLAFLFCTVVSMGPVSRAADPAPFDLREGDRVLFLGDTLLEREGSYGYLEMRMQEQFADRRFTVRNLAFSADTPLGWSRASFDPAPKGFERLKEQLALVKPTVVFLGYGMAASLQELTDRSGDPTLNPDTGRYGAEPMTAERFKAELGQLMDAIIQVSNSPEAPPANAPEAAGQKPAAVRFVLLSPIPHEDLRALKPALPDPASHNCLLKNYSKAIEELAKERGARFFASGEIFLVQLGKADATQSGNALPGSPIPVTDNGIHLSERGYELLSRHFASSLGWKAESLDPKQPEGAGTATLEKQNALRRAIIRKNELFFHRWRPANETYLFGFRKREQGQNAKEIPMFDPLIAQAEEEIERIKKGGAVSGNAAPTAKSEPEARNAAIGGKDVAPAVQALAGESTKLEAASIPPLPPPDFTVADGFQIELWAENPLLEKPTQSNWDPQGRLWVSSSSLYPMIEPGGIANDKILILEDPDRTGKATKSSVFADGLLVPTGVAPVLLGAGGGEDAETRRRGDAGNNAPPASSVSPRPRVPASLPIGREDAETRRHGDTENGAPTASPASPLLQAQGLEPAETARPRVPVSLPAGGEDAETRRRGDAENNAPLAVAASPLRQAQGLEPVETARPRVPASQHRYGCYVGQSTELLYLEDTDGNGKADKKRIVLSGFGTEDTHHIVHTLKWGPDGRLYFDQSVYIHTHAETPWGVVRANSGAVLCWDPRTEKLEVFDKGLWNSWGHQFDQWGQHFQTDGAGSTGITWSFPGAAFAPSEGARRTMQSISPGSYPKFCGLELIYSPHFPADWQGNAITCDFRAHRIVRFGITDLAKVPESNSATPGTPRDEPEGAPASANPKPETRAEALRDAHGAMGANQKPGFSAGYITQEMPDVVRTSDVSFRPIDVKLGPDGALYVADWSNPVINHGEVDFRDSRRDHHHGRIWRISKKDATPLKWEPLVDKHADELFGLFAKPGEPSNTWLREQALRVLAVKSKGEIESASRSFLKSDSGPSVERYSQLNLLRSACFGLHLEAYGTVPPKAPITSEAVAQSITGLSGESIARTLPLLLSQAATAESYFRDQPERRDAFRAHVLAMLETYCRHPHPRVRLGAIRALGAIPTARSADLVLAAAIGKEGPPADSFLEFAAWLSINELAKPWTDAIASGAWPIEGKEKQLEYGLNAINPALAGATVAKILAEGKVDITQGPWIEIIGRSGGAKELAQLFEALIVFYGEDCCPGRDVSRVGVKNLSEADALRTINALLEAARVRNERPEGDLPLAHLAPHAPASLRPGLLRLAGYWKTKDALDFLPAAATAQDSPPALRLAALEGLRAYGGKDALSFLDPLTRPDQPLDIRRAALVAITQVSVDAGIVRAADVLPALSDEAKALATWRELLQIQRAPEAFAVKFRDPQWAKNLPQPVLLAGMRAAREAGKNGQSLLKALVPLAGVTEAQTMTEKDYQRIAGSVKNTGNPANGELIYRRATSGCTTCHAIGGAGGKVGPELTSLGASAPLDYIIESVLAPNAKVKEGFNAITLALKDGTQATGIQVRETAEEVFLRNVAGQDLPVVKANITGKTDVGSIMPAGLLDQYTDRERLDLYAFLGELGKPGPYDASKGAVARAWRLYPASQAEKAMKQDLSESPAVAYTLVDGRLSKDRLAEALQMMPNPGDSIYATAQLQVAAAGKTPLRLTGVSKAWLDGQPLAVASEPAISPELAPGVHTLAVQLDVKALPQELRAEAAEARFLGN